MSNKKQNLKELKAKASEILNIDPAVIKEYTKIYARLKKHGDASIVMPKREKVSPEHKKEVKKAYYEKMKTKIREEKEAEKERLIAAGIPVRPRGRPRKTPLPENEEVKTPKPRGRPRKNTEGEITITCE